MLPFGDISAGQFGQLQQIVTEARFVAASLPVNDKYELVYLENALIEDNKDLIKRLAKLSAINVTDQPKGLRLALSNHDAWLSISEETLEEHKVNLETRLASTHQEIRNLEGRLSNENYVAKAPTALVEESKKQLQEKQALVTRLIHELELLQ
jgi:valyl-tRNA synthetase